MKLFPLTETLFGKTRRAVLSLLYGHTDDSFYMRQIVTAVGLGMGTVQRELKALNEAGLIRRTVRGKQVYYQAESGSPIFEELKSILVKTAGIADVLKAALEPLTDRIYTAFIYGSVARGEENRASDVDVLVIGEVTLQEVVSALSSVQKDLGREINPAVYPVDEFRSKLSKKHHFITSVMKEEKKIFLIGGEHDLKKLAGSRQAERAQNKSTGNQ